MRKVVVVVAVLAVLGALGGGFYLIGPPAEARARRFDDPETGEPYAYVVKSADTYELCAVCARESDARGEFWWHGKGARCFHITAKEIRP